MSQINLVVHGPHNRPSVTSWLKESTSHVYIGPPTSALRGSGHDHQEACVMEEKYTRYIHFFSGQEIDVALEGFVWEEGVDYKFGYHIALLPMHIVVMFTGKLRIHLESIGFDFVLGQTETTTLTSTYVQHYIGPADVLETYRERTLKRCKQHFFLGRGSVWEAMARETTRTFTDALSVIHDVIGEHDEEIELGLEQLIGGSDEKRLEWQAHYRLLVEQYLRTLETPLSVQNGVIFWRDVTIDLKYGEVRGFTLRSDLPVSADPTDVALKDFVSLSEEGVNSYQTYPGLMRAEVLTALFFPDISEIRGCGDEALGDIDAEVGKITMSSVCKSCIRIMPDMTAVDRLRLRDRDQKNYVLADIGSNRPFHECCVETMLNPYTTDIHTYDEEFYNVNPALPAPLSDRRTLIFTTHEPQQTPFLPLNNLIWTSEHGTDVDEVFSVRRYICRFNYPQCTIEDYKFMIKHPEGGLDHLVQFHTEDKVLILNAPLKRQARVKKNKKRKFS